MKTPAATEITTSAPNSAKFTGTENPRHLRVLAALLRRPLARENLDSIAGCSNGPALVDDLRSRGLEVPCERVSFIDRDGKPCRPGVYLFTEADRRKVHQWLALRSKGGAA
ncbi:MAG: hypothetical protein JSR69_09055 [Proteobacteria bacterium]|nr:hypothetical protein [Pseudomonadota bacterium]